MSANSPFSRRMAELFAPPSRPFWADQEGGSFAAHASGLTLHQVRNALLEAGHEVAPIEWQHMDGRHSFALTGADGGTYRLTISAETGK